MTELQGLQATELVFPRLGLELNIESTAFTIAGISITWYGLLITLGMLLAMCYGFSNMRRYGIDPDRAIDGVIGGVIGGIVGARLYYVAFHWDSYAGNIKEILNIRGGGLAIYGGVIGALLVGGIVCKIRKVRLLPMLDIASLGFLIGQCIGRWGNFFNHEAFGSNTDGLFGMSSGQIQAYIAKHFTDGSVVTDRPVHPCFLYESLWCLTGFILLHLISRKWRKFDGQIFLLYITWYGFGRFWIEGLRTDSLYLGTIRVSQLVAAVSVVAGLILFFISLSHVKRMGTDYVLYCNTEESKKLLEEADQREAEYLRKKEEKKSKRQNTERNAGESEASEPEDSRDAGASEAENPEKEVEEVLEEILSEIEPTEPEEASNGNQNDENQEEN